MYRTLNQFRVLPEHITLLTNANVGWDDGEFGAPAIDCKRPYGNSHVLGDIAKLLALPQDGKSEDDDPYDWEERYSPETLARMHRLHEETQTVLQIFLATGAMQPGLYEAEQYKRNWKRIGD